VNLGGSIVDPGSITGIVCLPLGLTPQGVGDRCENCTKKRQTLEGESRRIGW
jgi:hypothetical protein